MKTFNKNGSFVLTYSTHGVSPFSLNGGAVISGQTAHPLITGRATVPNPQQQIPEKQAHPVAPVDSKVIPGETVQGVAGNLQDNTNAFSQTSAATGGESPLDKFAEIFNTVDKDKDKDKGAGDPPQEVPDILSTSLDDFSTVSSKINFTEGLDAESVKKALEGDVESFLSIINSVGQKAFAQAGFSNTQVTKKALETRLEKLKTKDLPSMLRNTQTQHSGIDSNPELSHAAVSPVVSALQRQFAEAKPHATPAQLNQEVREYLVALGQLAKGEEQPQPSKEEEKPEDWDSFFQL